MHVKRMSFYQVDPKYFKDDNNDGIGDLAGLIKKFDYFVFLGVDAIILENVISADNPDAEFPDFAKIDSRVGSVNDLIKLTSIAKAHNIKILIELNLGTIHQKHGWFKSSEAGDIKEFTDVVTFSGQKENGDLNYAYSDANKKYYLSDEKTQEIPLNWNSSHVFEQFVKIINFWLQAGVSGFVLKKFEYLADPEHDQMLSITTLKELRKIYKIIKEINQETIVVAKSAIIPLAAAHLYVSDDRARIFDYILSTQIPFLDEDARYGIDAKIELKIKSLVKALKIYATDPSHILTFGTATIGRLVARWGDEGQFWQEAAKTLFALMAISKSSIAIYYGDEIGTPNLGLTPVDDFQTPDLEHRKHIMKKMKLSEQQFMEAQILQNPINARSLMAWNDKKHGGFSDGKTTITPDSKSFAEINVKHQFNDENSVLIFYRNLIKHTSKLALSKILQDGQLKITHLWSDLIKIRAHAGEKEVVVLINMTNQLKTIPLFRRPINGKVVISSYTKKYHEIPQQLDPYESVVISKQAEDFSLTTQLVRIQNYHQKRKIIRHKKQQEMAAIKREEERRQAAIAKAKAQKLAQEQAIANRIHKALEEQRQAVLNQEKQDRQKRQEAAERQKKLAEAQREKARLQKQNAKKEEEEYFTSLILAQEKERNIVKQREKKESKETKEMIKKFKKQDQQEVKTEATKQKKVSNHHEKSLFPEHISQGDLLEAELSIDDLPPIEDDIPRDHQTEVKTNISWQDTTDALDVENPEKVDDLASTKAKVQIERSEEYARHPEATKLKEEEVAKTTLIDDSIDIDALFKKPKK